MSIVGASLSEPHIDIYVSLSSGIPREVHQGKASFVLHVVCPLHGIPRKVHQGKACVLHVVCPLVFR